MRTAGSQSARGTGNSSFSPVERASIHTSRVRARDLRREKDVTPGPGAYTQKPKVPRTPRSARAGARSAFKSGSKRGLELIESGDPGAYNTVEYSSMGVSRSFSRSMRAGHGRFGATSSRALQLDIAGEDTPGPGAYRHTQQQRFGCELFAKPHERAPDTRIPSAAFRSSSAQRPKAQINEEPGREVYLPNMSSVQRAPSNAGHGFHSRSNRFGPDRQSTGAQLGPGAYSPQHASIAHALNKSIERMSRAGAGFGTASPARDLPGQPKDMVDLPGPGMYSTDRLLCAQLRFPRQNGCSSAFKSTSQRGAGMYEKTGDPGAYYPGTNRFAVSHDVASGSAGITSASVSRPSRHGAGSFGGTATRSAAWMQILGEDTPGPGSYGTSGGRSSGRHHELASVSRMPSAAFRSSSAQRPRILTQDAPGRAQLHPSMAVSSTVRSPPNGAGAAMRSKSNRFAARQTTGEMNGPGIYSQDKGLSMATSARRSAEAGVSASFRSDSVRELEWPV